MHAPTHVNDVQCLLHGGLLVEGESGVNLSRDTAGNDVKNLLAELNKEVVQCSIDLLLNAAAMLLSVLNGLVDELGVLGLLGGGEDQGRVGGGILRLVLANGGKVTGVAYDGLYSRMESSASSSSNADHADRRSGSIGEDGGILTVPVALSWSREEDIISVLIARV